MTEWTPAAEKRLLDYLESQEAELRATGADCCEVRNDLRDHIETQVREAGRAVVLEEDVTRVVGAAAPPRQPTASPAATPPAAAESAVPPAACQVQFRLPGGKDRDKSRVGLLAGLWLGFAGVFLPLVTVVLEGLTGMCAQILFDPLPSLAHAALVAIVPILNLLLLVALVKRRMVHPWVAAGAAGAAGGISLYYAIQFLPVTPFAILGIPFGVGLLALSPLLAYLAYFTCRAKIRRQAQAAGQGQPRTLWGLLAALLLLLAFDIPKATTYIGIAMADSEDPSTATAGLALLRRLHSDDLLLRLCYQRPGIFNDAVGMLYAVSGRAPAAADMRRLYYQVTGDAFNAKAPPKLRGGRDSFGSAWDPGVGGDQVEGQISGLQLHSSRLDASLDADGGVAYTEWTLEFRNDTFGQQEARCQVQLPPGGVVSRLTLWVDGEPREAAFAGRAEVRQAYQNVVRRSRDPVLVTTSGPDRVLVQCFPVPPNGGLMKIRLGISAPVEPQSRDLGILAMPRIIERNFSLPANVHHALWVEGNRPITCRVAPLTEEQAGEAVFAARGEVDHAALTEGFSLCGQRNPEVLCAWTEDRRATPSRIVTQTLVETRQAAPNRLILVIDASASLARHSPQLAADLATLTLPCPTTLIAAEDGQPRVLVESTTAASDLADAVGMILFTGGRDNVPALEMARTLAQRSDGSQILWLHGTQAVELRSLASLAQSFERRKSPRPILALQLAPGPNCLVANLFAHGWLKSIGGRTVEAGSLATLINQLTGQQPTPHWQRAVATEPPPPGPSIKGTSDHLARLLAVAEVEAAIPASDPASRAAATAQAARYQIVTPLSGAVVLETAAQYAEAGLEPVPENTVPTIPEPETWAMLIAATVVLGLALLLRRRGWTAAVSTPQGRV